jgi:hypothetical protein
VRGGAVMYLLAARCAARSPPAPSGVITSVTRLPKGGMVNVEGERPASTGDLILVALWSSCCQSNADTLELAMGGSASLALAPDQGGTVPPPVPSRI